MVSTKSTNARVLTVSMIVLLGLTMCCAGRTQLGSHETGGIYTKESNAAGGGYFDGSGRSSGFAQGPDAKSSDRGGGFGNGGGSSSAGSGSAGGSGSGLSSGSGFGNTGKSGDTSHSYGHGYTVGGGNGFVRNDSPPPFVPEPPFDEPPVGIIPIIPVLTPITTAPAAAPIAG